MNKNQFLKLYQGKVVALNNAIDAQAFLWYVEKFFEDTVLREQVSVYFPKFPIYARTLVNMHDGKVVNYQKRMDCFGASNQAATYDRPQLNFTTFFNDLLAVTPEGSLLKYGKAAFPYDAHDEALFYEVSENDGINTNGIYLESSVVPTVYTSEKGYRAKVIAFVNGKSLIKWDEGEDAGKLSNRLWVSAELRDTPLAIPKFKVGDRVSPMGLLVTTVTKIIINPFDRETA